MALCKLLVSQYVLTVSWFQFPCQLVKYIYNLHIIIEVGPLELCQGSPDPPTSLLAPHTRVVHFSEKIVISAIKGIIPETNLLVGEHLEKNFQIKESNFLVLGGPCHAEEVALEKLSYLTIASSNKILAEKIASKFTSSYIYVQTSDDVIGIEYSSMLKNIYAIAAGIAHGLGYGDNFQSVLMSSAIKEMNRFIEKRYLLKRDINDSVYLGDLLVTGYSLFSRNRLFGNMIGKGSSVKYAKMEMSMIAEGYVATKKAYMLNSESSKKAKIQIIESVYNILYLRRSPKKTFKNLCEKIN